MRAPFASAPPSRRRLLRGVSLLAVALLLVLGAAAALPRLTDRQTAVAQDLPGPVLLVPGYGGSTVALSVLADRLEAAGRETVVVELPGDGTGDLREAAAVLAGEVESAVAEGAPSVDVVGFSAGGVTARLYAVEEAGHLRRVVTLGSPHHGTGFAGLASALAPEACADACRQLVPGSPLLTELNADDETPDGPVWVSVWTAQDEVVTPPESGRLEGSVQIALQDVCPDARVAHGDLPRDPLGMGVVLRALGVDEPTRPDPDDCDDLRVLGLSS